VPIDVILVSPHGGNFRVFFSCAFVDSNAPEACFSTSFSGPSVTLHFLSESPSPKYAYLYFFFEVSVFILVSSSESTEASSERSKSSPSYHDEFQSALRLMCAI
jgi:hypothetical protein